MKNISTVLFTKTRMISALMCLKRVMNLPNQLHGDQIICRDVPVLSLRRSLTFLLIVSQ